MENDDVGADALNGIELMGAEEDDFARAASSWMRLRSTSAEPTSRPEKGLVEEDELGIVHQGRGDEDLLAHSLGIAEMEAWRSS